MRCIRLVALAAMSLVCSVAHTQGVKAPLPDPVIICPPNATAIETFAAQELARAIEAMTGKRPDVVNALSGAKASKIVLLNAKAPAKGPAPDQAYSILYDEKEGKPEVLITGKDRSLLYAVRDLSGKYLSGKERQLFVEKISLTETPAAPRRYLWLWLQNLKGDWKPFIDFASEWKCNGVVIWGLDAWKDDKLCREICVYAHERGVDVLHGFGVNGYHEGKHICETIPEAKAVIPEKFHNTENGKWSLDALYCPSNEKAQAAIKEMLLKAADAGIDGFNFETADVDYILCHCPKCEARFKHQSEELHANKPIEWPIEHTNMAVEFLSAERPNLWLCAEYAIQKFDPAPYVGSAKLERLAKEINKRCTVIWCESMAPPQPIAEALIQMRPESGFYIRSGAILGIEGSEKYKWEDELAAMRRLIPLEPKCVMYRSGIPGGYLAAKMAVAAEAMWNPKRADDYFQGVFDRVTGMTKPGGKYAVKEEKPKQP
ncbi:MAG: hypothetical protein AB1696_00325 [Planctomycetota bacterium]